MRRASKLLITMLTLVVLFAVFAFSASATEYTVSTEADLTSAISSAAAGDTIIVSGTITVTKQVSIKKNLTIKGSGDSTIIMSSSSTAAQVFLINGGEVTLENITIDGNGKSRCVYVYSETSSLIMNEGAIIQNGKTTGSNRGAGILVKGGKVIMNGGYITNNTAGGHGGGVGFDNAATTATFTMNGGYITNNTSGANGGAIFSVGSLYIKGGEISGNKAPNADAGVHASQGSLDLYHGVVFGTNTNTSTSAAGNNISIGGTAVLNFCFEWNAAKQAQTSLSDFGTMTIDGKSLDFPTTKGTKAGRTYIIIDDEVEISAPVVIPEKAKVVLKGKSGTENDKLIYNGKSNNRAITVSNGAELTLENITIDASASTNANGARSVVVDSGGTLYITDGTFITGGHGLSGAGIYNQGTVVMTGGSITGNASSGGAGGVNVNGGTFTMTGGSITGNTATDAGAGVYVHSKGTFEIGGSAIVSGNTTYGNSSNVCVQTNTNVTVSDTFIGEVGFHSEYGYQKTTTLDVATVVEGADTANIKSDDSKVTLSIASNKATLTFTEKTITIKSANTGEDITFSVYERDNQKFANPAAPMGYTNDDFVGYVEVIGYGTNPEAKNIYSKDSAVPVNAGISNLYALWLKVETETVVSVKLDGTTTKNGLRFISTVDSDILKTLGIKVKAANASGDGYYRGMVLGTSNTDLTKGLTKSNRKMDAKLNTTGWNSASYSSFTGKVLPNGRDCFTTFINYTNESHYSMAIAFRGYICIQIGGQEVTVYSEFIAPKSMSNSDDATYGSVHARSARAVVRKLYFNSSTTEAQARAALGDFYDFAQKIANYTFPTPAYPTAAQLTNYIKPLMQGGEITDSNDILHIGMFGNSVVCAYSMADIVEDLGAQDGRKIAVSAISYNNMGTSSSQSVKSLFKMVETTDPTTGNSTTQFADSQGNATTDPAKFVINAEKGDGVGAKLLHILDNIENTPMDKFYIVINREILYNYASTSDAALTNISNEHIAVRALAMHLNNKYKGIEFVVVVPPAFEEDDMKLAQEKWYSKSKTEMSTALKTEANNFVSEIKAVCPNNKVGILSLDDYYNQFALEDIDLLTRENNVSSTPRFNDKIIHRHPTMAGSYLNAMLFYYDITGRCSQGINVYGEIPQSEAERIQQEVHRLIGCASTRHGHTPLEISVASGTGIYKFADLTDSTVYPNVTQWNALLATIMAYEGRGDWFQYDQKKLNRNVVRDNQDYRHSGTESDFSFSSPEDATPYNTVFGDCSDWITQIFFETFNQTKTISNLHNIQDGLTMFYKYRSCADLYMSMSNKKDYIIPSATYEFAWTDDDNFDNVLDSTDGDKNYTLYLNGAQPVANYPVDQARTKFVETLLPGDIILYIHENDSGSGGFAEKGGHVMIYIGDGLLAHCSGDQAGGGGSDYNVDSKSDQWEHKGGIQIDPVDVFMDKKATRNIFDEAAVLIIRPDYSSYTVKTNAANRVKNMLGIVAYKSSFANNGTTVNKGDTISIDFVIKNTTPYLRDLAISETLPDGVEYVRGLSYTSGTRKVTGSVTLNPYETVTVSYEVKVTATAGTTVTMGDSTVGGVKMGDVVINVGKTLTAAEQTSFVEYIRANSGTYTDMYALAVKAYLSMNMDLAKFKDSKGIPKWDSAIHALDFLFEQIVVNNTEFYYVTSAYKVVRAGNLYGGLNVYANHDTKADGGYNDPFNHRAKKLIVENFIVGDIIVYVPQKTARSKDTNLTDTTIEKDSTCYVYLGDGVFAMYKDNVYTEIRGSEAVVMLERMLGEKLFTVMRPSLLF